jgi:hypothetical protein
MKVQLIAGAAMLLLLGALVGWADAAGATKSGPQVGDLCVPFEPLNVTGAFAGTKTCLV